MDKQAYLNGRPTSLHARIINSVRGWTFFSDFDAAPYNASTNTYLMDVAWSANGRWALIVGGESSYVVNKGLLVRFSLDP